MAYLLQDNDNVYLGYFEETSEHNYSFLATNSSEFYVENLDSAVVQKRSSELNESINYNATKVVKILKSEKPESCTITKVGSSLRIELKFIASRSKALPMCFAFVASPCESSDVGSVFVVGLMKSLMEKSLQNEKMRKALAAKDREIEERIRNEGSFIREALVTSPFDFEKELSEEIKLNEHRVVINADAVLTKSNIPLLQNDPR